MYVHCRVCGGWVRIAKSWFTPPEWEVFDLTRLHDFIRDHGHAEESFYGAHFSFQYEVDRNGDQTPFDAATDRGETWGVNA